VTVTAGQHLFRHAAAMGGGHYDFGDGTLTSAVQLYGNYAKRWRAHRR